MAIWRLAGRVAAAGLCLTSACSHRPSYTDQDRHAAVQQLVHSTMSQHGVPGMAVAIVRDGRIFDKLAAGSSNLAAHEAVSADTPFQLASTTKIFAAAAVMSLVADGKIGLDDRIGDRLSGLPEAWRSVTIRQLLSHTSGLPDITRTPGELDLVADNWTAALPIAAAKPFQFEPGTSWAYTQTNYAILQRLVEQESGQRFKDYLEQRFFRPLGMLNSFFPSATRSCAVNYERTSGSGVTIRDLSFPAYVHAAGGLCASLNDLIRWDQALDAGKILPLALAQEMWTPAKLKNGSVARIAGSISYGLGWAIDTAAGKRWVGHSGGNSTAFRRYPEHHLTIIVLHNGASDPDAIASALASTMLDQSPGGGSQAKLWDAASGGDTKAAEAAIAAGADVNAMDTRSSKNGRYALNWAAINDRADMIRFLLAHGARLNATNRTGFTALHHAAESGSEAAAQALIDAGADTSLRTRDGETAADVARRKGHANVAAIIGARRERR